MTREDALKIIKDENLKKYHFFDETNVYVNEIGIYKDLDKWIVYATSERAAREGIRAYDNESDALEEFIKRLRSLKRLNILLSKEKKN